MASMTKILLVEDSRFLRLEFERALSRAGYAVTVASDGEKAIEMAKAGQPDLVLLDLILPKLSGLDVLRTLKGSSDTSSIPVVVISGFPRSNAARLKEQGAFEFLEKSELGLETGARALVVKVAEILEGIDRVRARVVPAR